jgi:hypothetical protein
MPQSREIHAGRRLEFLSLRRRLRRFASFRRPGGQAPSSLSPPARTSRSVCGRDSGQACRDAEGARCGSASVRGLSARRMSFTGGVRGLHGGFAVCRPAKKPQGQWEVASTHSAHEVWHPSGPRLTGDRERTAGPYIGADWIMG